MFTNYKKVNGYLFLFTMFITLRVSLIGSVIKSEVDLFFFLLWRRFWLFFFYLCNR